jgi:vacuolar-type H+-ATPase subunit H
VQTQEAKQKQKDALERGRREVAELQEQLGKQYAEKLSEEDGRADQILNNVRARTTGYVLIYTKSVFAGCGAPR